MALLCLRRVVERLQAGLAVAGESGQQDWTAPGFLTVDGKRGLGPVAAVAALGAVIPRALWRCKRLCPGAGL